MAKRDYPSEQLTVHWDSELCIHSGHCVKTLRAVFDNKRRPWIDVEAAADETIREVVEGCPSRALTYTMHEEFADGDGAAAGGTDSATDSGVAADEAPAVEVRVLPNGPLEISGEVVLVGADGSERRIRNAQLCRCGLSSTKPFCDDSHIAAGFTDPDPAAG